MIRSSILSQFQLVLLSNHIVCSRDSLRVCCMGTRCMIENSELDMAASGEEDGQVEEEEEVNARREVNNK